MPQTGGKLTHKLRQRSKRMLAEKCPCSVSSTEGNPRTWEPREQASAREGGLLDGNM